MLTEERGMLQKQLMRGELLYVFKASLFKRRRQQVDVILTYSGFLLKVSIASHPCKVCYIFDGHFKRI